jgi:hypothetical protein
MHAAVRHQGRQVFIGSKYIQKLICQKLQLGLNIFAREFAILDM